MVVCKFFLQGTCKFGNTCRFEHQINDNAQGSSILKQPAQNSTSNPTMDPNTLVRSVISDMTSAEQGKQWFFSSYSPFKDKPAFPGFEDRSFDEIRLGFYEATQNGTVEQYKQMVQMWYQEALTKIKTLQNPNEEIVKVLMQIYNTPVANQSTVFQNNTGSAIYPTQPVLGGNPLFRGTNQPGNSIFLGGQNSVNNSIFGQKPIFAANNVTNNSPFSNNQSIFANANTGNMNNNNKSIFGQNNANNSFVQNPNNNSFAQSPINNSFAQNPNNNSFTQNPNNNNFTQNPNNNNFGPAPPNPTNNVFTQNSNFFAQNTFAKTTQNSIFGNNSIFNNKQSQQSPFAGQTTLQTPSPFGPSITPQVSPFTSPINQPTPFAKPPQPSPFVSTTNTTQNNTQPIFANTQTKTAQIVTGPFQNNANSVFGGSLPVSKNNVVNNTQPTQNIFVQNPVLTNSILNKNGNTFGGPEVQQNEVREDSWYSKLEELTEEEIKSFESDHFEIGKIPENPPTLQMCF